MICSNGSISVFDLRLQAEHDVAVHLHEAAVAVPGEALVAGLVDEAAQRGLVEADVEHGVHHAGHATRAPERQETSSGFLASPNLRPHRLFGLAQGVLDLGLELGRILAVVGVVVGADFGGDA